MAQCVQCLFENAPEAAACEQCGAELGVEVLSLQLGAVCRHCDSYNDPGVLMCVSCGEMLATIAADERASERPAPTPGAEVTGSPSPGLQDFVRASLAPTPQPWMAAPDTGEFAEVKKPETDVTPAQIRTAAAAVGEATAPPIGRSSAFPPSAVPPTALPPSALPPGWSTMPARPTAPLSRAEVDTVTCPRCQVANPPSARYCGRCGFGLAPHAEKTRGKLILIRGISGEGRQYPLSNVPTVAGRTGTIAFPEDPYIGAQHATFLFRGNDLIVHDEGAGNGIYVRLREPQTLRAGDMFSIGEHLLRYAGVMAAQAPPANRHGSPRPADRFQVIEEVLEGGGVGRVCKRPGPVVTIGRTGCDLNFPTDGFISARHAELSVAGETPFLRDVGSANGIFVRVQPRSDRVLQHGDYLLLGRELLRVEVSAAR